MFKTNDSGREQDNSLTCETANEKVVNKTNDSGRKTEAEPTFGTLAEFDLWLDHQLEALVECFSDYQTKDSVRGYFARSK